MTPLLRTVDRAEDYCRLLTSLLRDTTTVLAFSCHMPYSIDPRGQCDVCIRVDMLMFVFVLLQSPLNLNIYLLHMRIFTIK